MALRRGGWVPHRGARRGLLVRSAGGDVAQSPALRFGPADWPVFPLYIDYVTATGLPHFEQGKLCLAVEPQTYTTGFRVFWGGAQANVSIVQRL